MAKDPVCGMEVDEKKAAATSDYRGQTYYFCAKACKQKFDQSPARAGAKPAKAAMDVKKLQQGLQKLGYDPGPVDGMLGSKTRAALRTFQQDNGLKIDGKPGKATVPKMEALVKAKQ